MILINTKKKKVLAKENPMRKTTTENGNGTYVQNFTQMMIILKFAKTPTAYS